MAILPVILLLGMALPAQTDELGTDDTLVEITGFGETDWVSGTIRARGVVEEGVSGNTTNVAVNKLKTLRKAKIKAMRNAIEAMKSIRIDAGATIGNYMEGSEYIRKKMHGIMKKSRIVEKKELSQGGIEVEIELPIQGLLMETMVQYSGDIEISTSGEELYTGLIVDTTGLNVNPALSPRIINENGREIFSASYAERSIMLSEGLVGYSSNVSFAEVDSRVADDPLVVNALRRSGTQGTDIVISREDAAKILAKGSNLSWLKECRVIIIID